MKKRGILNAQLIYELTKIRHLDKIVICDAGLPIPQGKTMVDVSLVDGLPNVMQVLKAICNEMMFEEYTIFSAMKDYNKEYYSEIKTMFPNHECHEISFPDFLEAVYAREVKLFIRTGEMLPCSNIMLTSASGAPLHPEMLDVSFDRIV